MARKSPRHAGFSLIELMVIVAVAAVLVSIAWARMSTLAPIYQLEGAARNLATELQKTRSRAIAESKCFQVAFNVAARTYQVQSRTCTAVGWTNAGAAQKVDDGDGLTLTVSANPAFEPRGTVSSPAVITLTNGAGAARTVFVQSTGRVNVQ
jgi:type II secretion system protein H